jgi:hypothetical protein
MQGIWTQVYRVPSAFTLVSCSAYSTLNMEPIRSSETSVVFQWTTRRYIPDDSTLQGSYKITVLRTRSHGNTVLVENKVVIMHLFYSDSHQMTISTHSSCYGVHGLHKPRISSSKTSRGMVCLIINVTPFGNSRLPCER